MHVHIYYKIIGKELEGSICFPGKDVSLERMEGE